MVEGKYSVDVPSAQSLPEADVRQEMGNISTENANLYDQANVEAKLGDPGFFAYVQARAQKEKSLDMNAYLAGAGNITEIASWAENYDTKIKPALDKFKKFLSDEFVGKLKIIQGDNLKEASDAIESHLGKKAATDPDFAEKYMKLIDDFNKFTDDAKKIDQELKSKYKLKDHQLTQEGLTETAAAWQLQADKGADVRTGNETAYTDAKDKIGKERFNGWGRFKNTLRSFGRQRLSDGELAEKQQYELSQKKLDERIKGLAEASKDIAVKATEKATLTEQIGVTRKEILDNLEDFDTLRDTLLKIAKDAIIKGPGKKAKDKVFDTDDAASTLDEMGDVWGGSDPAFDAEMQKMMTEVYKREVTSSADLGKDARAISTTKMGQFNNFLHANISNKAARDMMESVIQAELTAIPVAEKSSPRAAQLTLMLGRTQAVKTI